MIYITISLRLKFCTELYIARTRCIQDWMKYWPTIFLSLLFYASLHIHRLPSSTIVMFADLNLPSGYLHPLSNFNFVNISLHWIGNNSCTTQSYWRGAIRSHSRKRIIHRKGCRRPHQTGIYFLLNSFWSVLASIS